MKRIFVATCAGLACLAFFSPAAFAGSGNNGQGSGGVKDTGVDYNKGKALAFGQGEKVQGQPPLGPAKVGDVRTWLALDDARGRIYLKNYTLRAVGKNIEVWVANNLNFPAGDCRNDGVRNVITDAQARYLIGEFDSNMYPRESQLFSVAPPRDGKQAILPGLIPNIPSSEYHGEGENIVALIDNVRDDNYYDLNNANGFSYIAGFYYSVFDDYFDRLVMSIDSFDWLHRTGANPPNEPVPGNLCTSAPARPFLYEGVFAHEYQHLLENYEDSDETSWVNEGLSDYAIYATGYTNPATPITQSGFDSHIQCFLGWLGTLTAANPNPRATCGPENSLTSWGDQGDGEILADYGAAFTFMLNLADKHGESKITALHREDANGFAGLQKVLGSSDTSAGLLHEWAAAVALDGVLDGGARLTGGSAATYQVGALNALINWAENDAFDTPGAPPNGSDYVRLTDGSGAPLSAGQISAISFNGSGTLPADPVEWTVVNGAFFSGSADLLDRSIIKAVSGGSSLSFSTKYNLEATWDLGAVQVSTDGGNTFTSLACSGTRSDFHPDAHPLVKANVPGFTGVSDWTASSCSLPAGTDYISFRLITDWSVEGNPGTAIPAGWFVDNVSVDGTLIADGTSLAGWQSLTEVNPVEVSGFTVQLVAYTDDKSAAWIASIPLDANFDGSLSGTALQAAIGTTAQTVAAIVTYDEPSETVSSYARYTLTATASGVAGGGKGGKK